MERKREIENGGFLPKRGNPLNETVSYKIGGTVFEIETSCGGSELLYDKMVRLIKSETVKTPTDKSDKIRYNAEYQPVCRAFITGGMNNDRNSNLSRQHHRFICPLIPRGCD